MLENLLIKLGVVLVERYIKSTENKNDDKVLEVFKKSSEYLSKNDNNTVPLSIDRTIQKTEMV